MPRLSVQAVETLQQHWRVLGIDPGTVQDAGATIRAESIDPWTRSGLPRISIDLPTTFSNGSVAEKPRLDRPDLEVMQVLGEGGMGRVFLARQRSLDREVAIKTLRDRATERDYEALLLEGAVTGHLEHPGIIPVHALGVHDDGRPVLVMKRVDGVSWQTLIEDAKHAAWESFGGDADDRLDGHLEILMQVCNAVSFAHSRGIVHRDIKPQNVLIGRFGDVYLADWGIAYRLGSGPVPRMCGTPAFMSPEMARGGELDVRADVYLLGATLHQLLTGRQRHEGGSVFEVLINAVESPPFDYPPSVPQHLGALANRATAADPNDRPATVADFRKALGDHVRHKSSTALARTALARLDRLRELESKPGDDAAKREVDLLVAEIRFALDQALQQWHDNADAKSALEELERILQVRRARAAELEQLARDRDPSISARPRAIAVAFLACTAVALFLNVVLRGVRHQPTPHELFVMSLVPFGMSVLVAIGFRRHVATSTINRQTAFGLLTLTSSIAIARGLGNMLHESTPTLLMHDCMLAAAVSAYSAISLPKWLLGFSGLMLAGAVTCASFPQYAHFTFNSATSVALLVFATLAWRQHRR